MTNEEKARKLSLYKSGDIDILRYDVAMDMAEWKDEQHAKEKESFFKEYRKEILDACVYDYEQKKQQLIERMVEWLNNNADKYVSMHVGYDESETYPYVTDDLVKDFKQAMEEL